MSDLYDDLDSDDIEEIGSEFQHSYFELNNNFENWYIDQAAHLEEQRFSFQKELQGFQEELKLIIEKITQSSRVFELFVTETQSHIQRQKSTLNIHYQNELNSINVDSNSDLTSLEDQTQKKLKDLDQSFNRSLTDLKHQFNSSNSLISNQGYHMKDDLKNIKILISTGKKSLLSFQVMLKVFLKEYRSKLNLLIQNLKKMAKKNSREKQKIQNEIQGIDDLININSQITELKNILNQERLEFQKKYEELQQNIEQIESKAITESIKMQAEFQSNKESETLIFEQKKKEYEEKIHEIENQINTKNIQFNIQFDVLNKDHISQQEKQEKEIKKLQLKNDQEINDINSHHKNLISKFIEQNPEVIKKSEITTKCHEQQQILEQLISQKNELQNPIEDKDEDFNSDFEKQYLEFEALENKIIQHNEIEYSDFLLQNEITFQSLSREHLQQLNYFKLELKEKYNPETYINEIKENIQKEKDFLNESYQSQYSTLLLLLNDDTNDSDLTQNKSNRSNNSNKEDELKQLLELKKVKDDEINEFKKQLLRKFEIYQNAEEERHMTILAKMNLIKDNNNNNNAFQAVREEFNPKIKILNTRISELANQLSVLSTSKIQIELVDFDKEENNKRSELENLQNDSNNDINNANILTKQVIDELIQKLELVKKDLQKDSEDFKKKTSNLSQPSEFKEFLTKFYTLCDKNQQAIKNTKEDFQRTLKSRKTLNKIALQAIQNRIEEQKKQNKEYSRKFSKIKELKMTDHQEWNDLLKERKSFMSNFKHQKEKINSKFDPKIESIREKIMDIKSKIDNNEGRPQELSQIARLEAKLKIKTDYLKTISGDLSKYKKQLIQQEGIYQSQFGSLPTVGVCRPTTAMASKSLSQNFMRRPFTASPMSKRGIRGNSSDVSLNISF